MLKNWIVMTQIAPRCCIYACKLIFETTEDQTFTNYFSFCTQCHLKTLKLSCQICLNLKT